MRLFKFSLCMACIAFFLCLPSIPALAAEPGSPPPPSAELSSQKTGSVLVYPYYTSDAFSIAAENTRLAITNHSTSNVFCHLFFVDNNSTVIDAYICLTQSQTASFLASDVDPSITGMMIAIAVGQQGQPLNLNFLSGEANVKLASGHRASYQAEAIAAIAAIPTSWVAGNTTATLNFDGVSYNRLPRTLAVDKLTSTADGNVTMLVIARADGNFTTPATGSIGMVSGTLMNDGNQSAPFTFVHNTTLLVKTLDDTFPRTIPPYTQLIPAGRFGWLTLAADSEVGLFGLVLNFNANSATQATAYTGGNHLRKLTLAAGTSLIIPIAAPIC